MSPSLWLRDLAAYSLQIALLVAAAALLARLFPLRPPAFALAYWQALLLACLLLPIGQPWNQPEPAGFEARLAGSGATAPAAMAPGPTQAVTRWPWPSPRTVLWVLGAGVAARAAWLALGFWTLGWLRRRGRPLDSESAPFARVQARLGVRAEFFTSDETDVPITFGLRRPAVLLPEAVLGMEPQAQQAILCHELLHVRRRDWLYAVLEEGVRALLWFHPAVGWLVGRIHLSREQAVDRDVIAITESREDYVGALLAVASARPRRELVAATLFLRKGRLKQRVSEILKEGSMSKKRLISHLLASAGAVLLAAGAAVRLFPLEARASGSDDGSVQVLRGGENLLHRAPVEYPRRAIEKGVEGEVLLALSLDDSGQVQDARVLSGPEELRKAALQSVLRWHYGAPAALPGSTEVLLQFKLGSLESVRELAQKLDPRPDAERVERQIEELRKALEDEKVSGERRAEYQHQLREREQELIGLDHKRRLEQDLRGSEAALLKMTQNVTVATLLSREDEQRLKKEMAEQKALFGERGHSADEVKRQIEELKKALEDESVSAERREKYEHQLREREEQLNHLAEAVRENEHAFRGRAFSFTPEQSEAEFHALQKKELADQKVMHFKLLSVGQPLEGRLTAIHAARFAPDARKALLAQLGVSVGDTLDAAAVARVRAAVARFDEHVRVELSRAPDGGLILLLVAP